MKAVVCGLALLSGLVFAAESRGQNQDYPGHLGVFVMPDNYGMQIQGFIRDTPAEALAQAGDLARRDTIVRLGGQRTRSLQELIWARNRIPEGKEAKMVMKDRSGGVYHVWIWRSDAVAMTPGPGFGRAQASSAPPVQMRVGGRGEGEEGDFRDRGTQDGEPNEEGGTFRERK